MTWRTLLRREDGSTALEMALLALPLFTVLVGFFEVALVMFASAALEGAALDAARFGATGAQASGVSRPEQVRQIILDGTVGLLDSDELEIETLVYPSFDDIGEPEPLDDANGNGVHDAGETFTDINGNGVWDQDMGAAGLGGPEDVVVYRVFYDWAAITPLIRPLMGTMTLSATVPVRNEPY